MNKDIETLCLFIAASAIFSKTNQHATNAGELAQAFATCLTAVSNQVAIGQVLAKNHK